METSPSGFGEYLRQAIASAGLRSADVARALAVDPATVSRWITEKRQPTRDELEALADLLVLDVAELLERSGRQAQALRRRQREAEGREPITALRRDVARLPMRPAARGALVKLAEELSRVADDECLVRFEEAWQVVTGKYAAGDVWDVPTLLATIRDELHVEMFEAPSRTRPPR